MWVSRGALNKSASSALRTMSSCPNERPLSRIRLFASKADFRLLSPRAPICDPCRGFGSSRLFGICPHAQTSDPCRGFGPSPPTRPCASFPPRLPGGDFAWEVVQKWLLGQFGLCPHSLEGLHRATLSRIRLFPCNADSLVLSSRPQISDPCRGFGSSVPRLTLRTLSSVLGGAAICNPC